MKKTGNLFSALFLLSTWLPFTFAQESPDVLFPVKGFCIGVPNTKDVDRFVKFINEELALRGVNTLLLLVDYNYQFESYPQFDETPYIKMPEKYSWPNNNGLYCKS